MGDVEGLVRLSARLFVEDAGGRDPDTDTSWPARRGREHFLGLLSREDAVCLLALSDGTKVGYLAGYVREKTAVRPVTVAGLQSMYVEEGERGSGVGARLVGKFFAWAGGLGVERVFVTAHAGTGTPSASTGVWDPRTGASRWRGGFEAVLPGFLRRIGGRVGRCRRARP